MPAPVNTLGKPGNCTVTLDETGTVNLKWKCANSRATGTVYQIWQRIGAAWRIIAQPGIIQQPVDIAPNGNVSGAIRFS